MSTLAFSLGPWEIIMVLGIFLLLFGSTKLPKLARSLGSSMTEFKKGLRGDPDDDTKNVADGDEPAEDGDEPAGKS